MYIVINCYYSYWINFTFKYGIKTKIYIHKYDVMYIHKFKIKIGLKIEKITHLIFQKHTQKKLKAFIKNYRPNAPLFENQIVKNIKNL